VERKEAATARQQISKHAPTATDMHATLEELLDEVFSILSIMRLYSEDHREKLVSHESEVDSHGSEDGVGS
jgi:hypothetical protein